MKKLYINFALFNRLFAGEVRSSYTSRCRTQQQNVWLFTKHGKRQVSNVFIERLINKDECVSLYNDNQSAISWANGHRAYNRKKHIDMKYHFVREAVESDVVKLFKTQMI